MRVKAAALNLLDTLIIAGKYQHKPPFPFSPAAEFAGEVEIIGTGVTGINPGDRVIGNIGWGAAREKVAVAVDKLVAMPAGTRFRSRRRRHRHLRHHALCAEGPRPPASRARRWPCWARPAVPGSAAVEIGKLMGARVIACASSDDKIAFAREHGADEGVNYADERSEGRAAPAHRRQWRECGLRSDRRRAGRSRVARHGLGRALSW